MQFIERNSFNVRATVYRFKHPNDLVEFVLFPMIHVGTIDYYRDVRRLLEDCDCILFEGLKSTRARILTLSYRLMVRRKRLGLVTQDEVRLWELRDRLIHADIDAASFGSAWSSVPLWLRAVLTLVVPFYSLYLFLFATRESIARGLELGDLPTREEILNSSEESEQVENVLVHRRDAHLITVVEEIHRRRYERPMKVAVVYGAAHMRAVSRHLINKLGYKPVGGDFVTVFEL